MYRMSARLDGNRGKMGATAGQHGDTQTFMALRWTRR
jgi:hypothetical protein